MQCKKENRPVNKPTIRQTLAAAIVGLLLVTGAGGRCGGKRAGKEGQCTKG